MRRSTSLVFGTFVALAAVGLIAIQRPRFAESEDRNGRAEQRNMALVGFNDLQARSAYQPIIQKQGSRYIAYIGHHGSHDKIFNARSGKGESNGTSIVDVTDARHPVYLAHIEGQECPGCLPHGAVEGGGAQMVRACDGNALPHGQAGHTYLLRTFGTINHEIWDVTDPSRPQPVRTVQGGNPIYAGVLKDTHKSWWDCSDGIAFLVSGDPGWRTTRMTKVYDLSDPANPVFKRDFGLTGQEPGSKVQPVPTQLHGPISLGPVGDRVYFGYGTGSNGILQIVKRSTLLSTPSSDLLSPQLGRLNMYPFGGAHTVFPLLRSAVPSLAGDIDPRTGAPNNVRDFVVITDEALANQCTAARQMVFVADVTAESLPFTVASYQVPEASGHFCSRGGRFGSHSSNESFAPVFYGKLTFHAWFNAGVRALDVRDPFNPVEVGFYIPAVTDKTDLRCVTISGVERCKTAIQTNNVETDDRGYIYIVDRADTGLHILRVTGRAQRIVDGRDNGRED